MLIKVFPKTSLKINKPLVYECKIDVALGDIVKIPLGKKETLGIVVDKIENKSFNFPLKQTLDNKTEYIPLNMTELKIIKYIIKYYCSMISSTINPYITRKIDTSIYKDEFNKSLPPNQEIIQLTKEQNTAIKNIWGAKIKNIYYLE